MSRESTTSHDAMTIAPIVLALEALIRLHRAVTQTHIYVLFENKTNELVFRIKMFSLRGKIFLCLLPKPKIEPLEMNFS